MLRNRWCHFTIVLIVCATPAAFGQEGSSAAPQAAAKEPTTQPARGQAALEARFRESLTGVELRGSWRMTSDLAAREPLGAPREEKYTIHGVEKLDGDRWTVNARIQFGEKDVTIPVVVRVVWAEDTPIITVNELTMPMLGTYSARVMIYRGYYVGTWFGPNYGGVMSGELVKVKTEPAQADKDEPDESPGGDEP